MSAAAGVKTEYLQTDFGLIPIDWSVTRIDADTLIKTGSRNTQDRVDGGEYPFYVRSQQVESINSFSYDGEAVLTAGDGVGTGKVFHYINGKFDVHQRVYRISDFSNRLHGRYFFYQFSTRFYDRIMSMTAKSSVDSVRMEMIAGMQIPLPPIHEQSAIAAALDDIDALLINLNQLIAKKRDIQQATMQQLLTGQRRLPGFSDEWKETRLGDCLLANPNYGINAPAVEYSDTLPTYIRITDINDDGYFSPLPRVSVDSPVSGDYLLEEGDVVFARTGASVGKSYRYSTDDGPLVFAGFLIRVRPNQRKLIPAFLAASVTTKPYWNWVRLMSMRSGQPGINANEYASYTLLLPCIEEQAAIATILSDMGAEIATLEARRDKARQLKQGMMQELLTGRIRLV